MGCCPQNFVEIVLKQGIRKRPWQRNLSKAVFFIKKETLEKFPRFLCPIIGGVREIRTLAGLTTSNDLANRPLQPLEYHSIYRLTRLVYYKYIRMSMSLKRK